MIEVRVIAAEEAAKFRAIMSLPKEERAKQWKAYPEHFDALPQEAKPAVYHELCKLSPERSTSGFHGFNGSPYAPIFHCGWADYGDTIQGIGFGINRASFLEDSPELYYTDDDMMGELRDFMIKDINRMLVTMNEHSSGLNVSLHEEFYEDGVMFRGRREDSKKLLSFRITLDASKVKDTMRLGNRDFPASETGGYVLVLPKVGEFFCELGEILNGQRVPLLYDDYCIK